MKLPSYDEFVKNQSTYYAFAVIVALVFVFGLFYKSEANRLKDCNNGVEFWKEKCEKSEQQKTELLERIINITQKQNLKDSIQ